MKNSNDLPIEWVTRIFMRLHGRFGNAFFDKFRIGELNANNQDIGIENAKIVWSEELAGISPERIKNALSTNFGYAPSCDDFKLACRSTPDAHKDFKALPKPTMSQEKIDENLKKLTAITGQVKPKTDPKKWARDVLANPAGLPDISIRFAREAQEATA